METLIAASISESENRHDRRELMLKSFKWKELIPKEKSAARRIRWRNFNNDFSDSHQSITNDIFKEIKAF